MSPANSPLPDEIWDWHDAAGCHKHSGLGGGLPLTVCCVCDNEDPCVIVRCDLIPEWDSLMCEARTHRGQQRCNGEAVDGLSLCIEHLVERHEDMRERHILDRYNDETGATL